MTTVAPDVRVKRIAWSFARQYYTNYVQSPEKLSAYYGPNASVNHGTEKSATGAAEIAKLFAKIYSSPNAGTVSIVDVVTKTLENGNFEMTIYGVFHPVDRKNVELEFTHVVEMNEGLADHFAVVSDKRTELVVPKAIAGMDTWAAETPPMFASHGNEPTPAPLSLTNSQAKPNGSAPAVAPQPEATPAAEVQQAAAPVAAAEEPVKEAEAAEKPAPAQKKEAAEKKTEAAPKPAAEPASKSFLDAVRKQAAGNAAAPIRVSAAPAQAAEKPQAPAAAKKAASPKDSDKPAPKREPKAAAAPGGNGNAKEGAAPRKKRETEKAPRSNVVFFDIIVKGLPETTTEESVNELISPIMPIKQLKVQSQKGKQDKDATRTFAFVQLDHAKITESGSDVKAAVAKVLAETKNKRINGTRIMVEEVHDKFLTAAPERSS